MTPHLRIPRAWDLWTYQGKLYRRRASFAGNYASARPVSIIEVYLADAWRPSVSIGPSASRRRAA